MEKNLDKYKTPIYAEKVKCIEIGLKGKNNEYKVVLKLDDDREITYKLKKEVATNETIAGIKLEDTKTELVKKEEINNYLPEIFKKIAEYLKENKEIELYISYNRTALEFDDEVVIYNYMRDYHIETIYSKKFYGDDEKLKKQKEMLDKYNEKQKLKPIA